MICLIKKDGYKETMSLMNVSDKLSYEETGCDNLLSIYLLDEISEIFLTGKEENIKTMMEERYAEEHDSATYYLYNESLDVKEIGKKILLFC